MADPGKPLSATRVSYHDGQLLDQTDFQAEQDYHRAMRTLHNRSLHTWGIVNGLEVQQPTKDGTVVVTGGLAIDGQGRELQVLANETRLQADLTRGDRYLIAQFAEEQDREKDSITTRTLEQVAFSFTDVLPTDGSAIVLAQVKTSGTPDLSKRTPGAGLKMLEAGGKVGVAGPLAVGTTYARWDQPQAPSNSLLVEGKVGIGTNKPEAALDITASTTTTKSRWYEAIRLSRPEHSAITHPGGGLLFGLHQNRGFYFVDAKDGNNPETILKIDADKRCVGILTEAPTSALHVHGDARFEGDLSVGTILKIDAGTRRVGILTEAPTSALHVKGDARFEGKLMSPLWNVTRVFDRTPGTASGVAVKFKSGGGTLIVLWSGTAFAKTGESVLSLQITIDDRGGLLNSWVDVYTHDTHHTVFPSTMVVFAGLIAGEHELKIQPYGANSQSDKNDRYDATVLELPF